MQEPNLQNLEKRVTEIQGNLETMTKRAEEAERNLTVAKMSEDQRKAYDALSKAEQDEYHTCKEDKCKDKILAKGMAAVEKANAVPEHIQKRLDEFSKALETERTQRKAAEAAITKAQDEANLAKFSKQASEELSKLPGTAEENGAILKTLNDKLTAEEFGKVLTLLKAGNASHTTLMEGVGKGTGRDMATGSAWAKIEALAKSMCEEVSKSGKSLTEAEAVDKVLNTEVGAKLYTQYLQEGARQ